MCANVLEDHLQGYQPLDVLECNVYEPAFQHFVAFIVNTSKFRDTVQLSRNERLYVPVGM